MPIFIFKNVKNLASVFLLLFVTGIGNALAEDSKVAIKKTDRCPVCGMFVYKYPKWVARIVMKNGEYYFYDGAKDMFKHYFDTVKYTPGKSAQEIDAMDVTDYYQTELIDAKNAYYVIGSDVLGPMGHELLPFKDEPSAKEFMADHHGKNILRFQEISPQTIEGLDASQ
ncbi:MAG: nitrous oxide reductase accessory protein NosL [Methylococcaceae bacterium]|nr:nitrous oxide reductase accessory protein NosL [Methylococcaceae bacterium]